MNDPSNFSIGLTALEQLPSGSPHNTHKPLSFQSPLPQLTEQFCSDFIHLQALAKVGKRITDPNVVTFNSTQKQMVQTIVDTNSKRTDYKSKFLTQRANKFLRILWKAEKYSDQFCSNLISRKSPQKIPNYATPIHNFKRHKYTANNSFGSQSNGNSPPRSTSIHSKSPPHKVSTKPTLKKDNVRAVTSRVRNFNSEDKKFEKIRLSPRGKKVRIRQPSKEPVSRLVTDIRGEKEIEIDLSKNLTLTTMVTTKKFENMLQLLKNR